MRPIVAMLVLCCAACGEGHSEVVLVLKEDASKPCFGAAHIEIQVEYAYNKIQYHHSFRKSFTESADSNINGTCDISGFKMPDLPLGNGITIRVLLHDSTSDSGGVLSTAEITNPMNIDADSPNRNVEITLSRANDRPKGTVIINPLNQPTDWSAATTADELQFRIIPEGQSSSIRGPYFTFPREIRSNPFPLIISGMPEAFSHYRLVVEAWKKTTLLITWTVDGVELGPGANPAIIDLGTGTKP